MKCTVLLLQAEAHAFVESQLLAFAQGQPEAGIFHTINEADLDAVFGALGVGGHEIPEVPWRLLSGNIVAQSMCHDVTNEAALLTISLISIPSTIKSISESKQLMMLQRFRAC